MLTQSAPALINALAGVLPDRAARALTQALGNCNQPLAHRGPVSLSPARPQEAGPGYLSGGRWNPQSYQSILPTQESAYGVDVPGWDSPGGWGSSNYYGDTFNFPTNQEFTLNSYFGGPNLYNAGDQYVSNNYSNTVNTNTTNTTNLNVTNINGVPVLGPAGPQGRRGERGERGERGGGGQGYVLAKSPISLQVLTGQIKTSLDPAGNDFVKFNTAEIQLYTGEATVDPETCKVTLTTGDKITVLTGVDSVGKINIEGLKTTTVLALADARLVAIN